MPPLTTTPKLPHPYNHISLEIAFSTKKYPPTPPKLKNIVPIIEILNKITHYKK